MKNIQILTRKRYEHLSPEEKAKRVQAANLLSNGKELEKKIAEDEEKSRLKKERKEKRKAKLAAKRNSQSINNNSKENSEISTTTAEEAEDSESEEEKIVHKTSLPPPPPSSITFEQYFKDNYIIQRSNNENTESAADDLDAQNISTVKSNNEENNSTEEDSVDKPPEIISTSSQSTLPQIPHLGREIELKEERKKYSATVWMCDSFPLSTATVVDLLEMAAPQHRHVRKFKNFIANRMPAGFPIKIHMPVFPTISATITFVDYSAGNVDPSKFQIPAGYKADAKAFDKLTSTEQ